jgi:prolyl oligopeptidase
MTIADQPLTYPQARRSEQVDSYHRVQVADPYRWLEDPDSPETRAWIEAENVLTERFLEGIPERAAIYERLTHLWNYERYSLPFKQGERYFLFKNDGLQNQSVLYTLPALDAEPRVLLDPNTLSEVGTGVDRPDLLRWSKFSDAAWTHDNAGFFYSRYDEPDASRLYENANYYHKLYYHRLGTDQDDDVLVYSRPDEKQWMFYATVTDDGRYLLITVSRGTDPNNLVFIKDLASPDAEIEELIGGFDAEYGFVDNLGLLLWFRTNRDAPRYRVIGVHADAPGRERWREVIAEREEAMESVNAVGGRFIASYLKDAHSLVRLFTLEGAPAGEVPLPGIGAAGGFGGRLDEMETFYVFTSFTYPAAVFRYDIAAGVSSLYRQPAVDFNPDDYETVQVFATSKDGSRVLIFLTYRKGLEPNGQNPTVLYGYGGFNISMAPAFSVPNLVWLELGGVYASVNLRGGGEYGEQWYRAGTKLQKQNVFDDFIAAAEFLIAAGYTSTPKLAISGRSNGGLLVGAVMTQRPELFGAALPGVGVLDMLRFHEFTIGWAWVSDYGSVEDPEEFKALHAYSPLHNIRPGTAYPPTLITTADHDDRVVPAHSFKFAAALQAAQGGPAPVLIRIETSAGHGALTPTMKLIEEAADRTAFLVKVLEMQSER